jgi:hypothetical protein
MGVPSKFVLKQIENEIHAGFAFVDAASRHLKVSRMADAESRLSNAASPADSVVEHIRIVTHSLNALREAVDFMLETHLQAR